MQDYRKLTLVADGTSDVALLPILQWLWEQHFPEDLVDFQFADLSPVAASLPSKSIRDRLPVALDLYPCEILFIHRDAEKEPPANRYKEIMEAISTLPKHIPPPKHLCVVPVRMSEAWMLSSEAAIRKAADNPNGKTPLALPHPSKIEQMPDPKETLYQLLTIAKSLPAQRRRSFNPAKAALLVTGHMLDFSALRKLPSFQRLETDLLALRQEIT